MVYSVTIEWSPEDNAFIARVPEMPGCVADGDTREAALTMLYEVADAWLACCSDGPSPRAWPEPRLYGAKGPSRPSGAGRIARQPARTPRSDRLAP